MNQNYKKLSSLSRSESNLSNRQLVDNESSNWLERPSDTGFKLICTKREVGSRNVGAERDVDEVVGENSRRIETVKHGHVHDLQTERPIARGFSDDTTITEISSSSHERTKCDQCRWDDYGFTVAAGDCRSGGLKSSTIPSRHTLKATQQQAHHSAHHSGHHSTHHSAHHSRRDEMREFSELLIESITSSVERRKPFEINDDIYVIFPSQASEVDSESQPAACEYEEKTNEQLSDIFTPVDVDPVTKKMFNLRVKDEMRIDLKTGSSSSLSLQGADRHDIYPIEEVTEGSTSSRACSKHSSMRSRQREAHGGDSSTRLLESRKTRSEEEKLQAAAIIESLSRAREVPRPPSRRPQQTMPIPTLR